MDDLNLWIIIAQIINFWIIFFIFKKFLWETIIKTIEERRTKMQNLDASDSVVKEKIKEAESEAEDIIKNAREEALAIQKNAEEISKNNTKQKIEEAEQKAKNIVDSAARDVEKERLSMVEAMRGKVLDLSLKINSKVFENKESNKEFITKEVNSVKL